MEHSAGDLPFPLGSLVGMYRSRANLTQQELAEKAGLSVAALRDYEQGRRCRLRPDSLAALTDALGLTPDQSADLARAAAIPRRSPGLGPLSCPAQDGSGPVPATGSSGHHRGLWLSVLGPFQAWEQGTPLSLGSPARRAILGLLVLAAGELVHRHGLIDMLWRDGPPRTAPGLVQAHVSRIRRLLGLETDSGRALDSVGGGYRLVLPDSELDLLTFRDQAGRAAAAQASGDIMTAAELYEQAMRLWKSDPLADIDALRGHPCLTALKQELSGTLLRYAEVAGWLGQPYRVLSRLRALADAEPLNEQAHARLVIALAGAGRQAAAIGVYKDMRSRLDRELGLYPGEELSEAYTRVLQGDIRLGSEARARARRPALAATTYVMPRQLPAAPRAFTGRGGELEDLSGLLERDSREAGGVVIAALTGMAGIGKTALAVHWAHRVAGQFPDGQLFVNLHGFSAAGGLVAPEEALGSFLTALGTPPAQIPADLDGRAALYRTMLAGRSMLILLDNARDAEQVRPLLPGSPGCLTLVTSRNRLTGLAAADGARLISLSTLTDCESRDLLSATLDAGKAMAEPSAISELITLCERLPLALCDASARAVARPGLSLSALVDEMRGPRSRLDVLDTGESATSVRVVFSWSRAKLGQRASRMFQLLGIHPGPDITVSTAASLAGVSREQAYLALTELCDEHLLTERGPGRYSFHDLLRTYAAERALSSESGAERDAAVCRVLDYYLHAANAASEFLCPYHIRVVLPRPRTGVALAEIGGSRQAEEWFENERHALLAVISQAAEDGHAPYAWKLPWVAGWYFRDKAAQQRLVVAQESALTLAVRRGDLAGQVMAREHLGWLGLLLGDIASAGEHLDAAIELASRLDDRPLRMLVGLSHAYFLHSRAAS